MEATVDPTADFSFDPDVWENMTAANNSSVFSTKMSPVMDKIINLVLIVVLTITMVAMGCTMEVTKIKVTSNYCPTDI